MNKLTHDTDWHRNVKSPNILDVTVICLYCLILTILFLLNLYFNDKIDTKRTKQKKSKTRQQLFGRLQIFFAIIPALENTATMDMDERRCPKFMELPLFRVLSSFSPFDVSWTFLVVIFVVVVGSAWNKVLYKYEYNEYKLTLNNL